jgi:hypothetical protein
MTAQISRSTRAVGFWSAVLATTFSLTYVVGQLAEWAGWLVWCHRHALTRGRRCTLV